MKILLDIDGVMVPAASWKMPDLREDGFPDFSKKAVVALNRILSDTNASIVLTTTHKSRYAVEAWETIFANRGIRARISKLNITEDFKSRKEEVLEWLVSSHNKETFVIIDDDKSLSDLPAEYKQNLVLTSPLIGLNEEIAGKVIGVLLKNIN